MFVKNIKLSNFKSFKKVDIELGNFNVLIGANASGKSNFTKAFRFLKNIEKEGLDDAISISGGIENLWNIHASDTSEMKIQCTWGNVARWVANSKGKDIGVHIESLKYSLSLGSDSPEHEYSVKEDKIAESLRVFSVEDIKEGIYKEKGDVVKGKLSVSKTSTSIDTEYDSSDSGFEDLMTRGEVIPNIKSFLPNLSLEVDGGSTSPLLLEMPYFFVPPSITFASETGLYDIDPALARLHAPIAGKTELEENGSNLALVLREIVKDKEKKRKLVNLLQNVLPFVKDIDAKKSIEKAVMLTIKEEYYEDKSLPSDLLSDGTINIVALIVALYFEEQKIVIIEEPERNIHPSLISSVVNMMQDASSNKQIIVTTHSPIVVKHAGLDNLLFVSRDFNGYSHVSKPNQQEDLKIFMQNDLGLDEIYVQNLFKA